MKREYKIYFIINETKTKTYVGFSNDLEERTREHRNHKVRTTRNFGNFKVYILEIVENIKKAMEREKYWKSHVGRKRLKKLFDNL